MGHKLGWREDDIAGAQKLVTAIGSATLIEGFDSASYGRTSIGALCPITSMAPVLAITGMVARTRRPLTPLGRLVNRSSPGRTASRFSEQERKDAKPNKAQKRDE